MSDWHAEVKIVNGVVDKSMRRQWDLRMTSLLNTMDDSTATERKFQWNSRNMPNLECGHAFAGAMDSCGLAISDLIAVRHVGKLGSHYLHTGHVS